MTKKRRSKEKSEVPAEVSAYFRELARRRNAGRTKAEMRESFYANGLDRYQFSATRQPARQRKVEPVTEAAPNEQPTPPVSAVPVAPALSWEERQRNRERWDGINRQVEEIHLQDEQERIRQELSRARSVRPKPLWGIGKTGS